MIFETVALCVGFVAATWTGHTARSRQQALVIRSTVAALGWKQSEMAERLGLTPSEWSRQLNGSEPFNHWRLAELPDVFQAEYDKQHAALRGAVVLEPDLLAIFRGLATQDKPMAVMSLPTPVHQQKEQAS